MRTAASTTSALHLGMRFFTMTSFELTDTLDTPDVPPTGTAVHRERRLLCLTCLTHLPLPW